MIKFNLQHFRQQLGLAVPEEVDFTKKKKKTTTVPKPDEIPVVTKAPETKFAQSGQEKYGMSRDEYLAFAREQSGIKLDEPSTTNTERLQNALNQQAESDTETVAQQIVQPTKDYSDQIRQQNQAQTDALLAEIRNRIAQSKAQQQQIIERAPQQFDPLRAQSEVAKSQQLRSALERASVRGDRGGIGRSEALATQTAGENRLNQINLAQQNVISDANAEIARLENEGRFQEAQVKAAQSAQLLHIPLL